jgi:competence protein ComEC
MFSRPLVPALCATIIGILVGHNILVNTNLPAVLLPLAVLLWLGILFIVPFKVRPYWLMAAFTLIGINSQINDPSLSGLPPIIRTHERVVVEGTIYNPPRVRVSMATVPVRATRVFLPKGVERVKINLLAKIYGYRGGLKVGDRIRFPAKLKEFTNFNNPGGFDYQSYMKRRGISLVALVSDGQYVVPMGRGDLGLVTKALERIRGPLRRFFREKLPATVSPIYTALILGERQGLTSRLREPFDRSGVGHIMAVSGLHLGLVAWLSYMTLRWLLSLSYRLTLMTDVRRLAAIITTVPVTGYGLITGLHVSSQRAMIMVLVFLWSVVIGREKDVWSSLSLAALIILTIRGDSLFATSFQLSFVAVAGILWLAPVIIFLVPKFLMGDHYEKGSYLLPTVLKYVVGLIAVTTAATIITVPLLAHHFYRLSVVALPANLTVVPIIGLCVIPLGLLSCVVMLISATLASALLSLGGFGLNLAISFVRFWSDIRWSSVWVIRPHWWEVLLLYGMLFVCINLRRSIIYRVLLALCLAVLCADIGYWLYQTRFNRSLRITILDAGGANVALIQFPGKERMLIVRNTFKPESFSLARRVVAPFLWHERIERLDYLFLADVRGEQRDEIRFLIENFHPKEVFSERSIKRALAGVNVEGTSDGGVTLGYRGCSFAFSEMAVQIKTEKLEGGQRPEKYLIVTEEKAKRHRLLPAVRISETGALTITVDTRGAMTVTSFLEENLPCLGDCRMP